MLLSELVEDRGWTEENVADLLGAAGVTTKNGGKPVTPAGVRIVLRRNGRVPAAWREALGLEQTPPASTTTPPGEPGDAPGGSQGSSGRRREHTPTRPPDAKVLIEPGASKRISGAYKFLGAALAAGTGSEGVAAVWGDSSDKIAELWVSAAQENPWAARFVNMMSAGGPAGDLAAGHLYLAGATLYVLGAGIPGGDAIFAKYSRYRPVTPHPDAQANGKVDGAAASAAQGAVADPAG